MPTNYPASLDVFTEPSIPEETVLSQAGTGSRNHPEHHRDMGDAIEALQRFAAQLTHDHGGDTGGDFDTQKLLQANTHEGADTDSGADAIHHTLGEGANEAAPGDHRHDYNGPSIYNQPLLLCTSSTRPPNPHVGLMIYETDTNRVRAWSTFMDNVSVVGLSSTDQFMGAFPNGLDPDQWDYFITSGDLVHGHPRTAGGFLDWVDEIGIGGHTNRMTARRINPADKETQGDDQVITWKNGSSMIEAELPFTQGASNDVYFRMSADKQRYIRLRVGSGELFTLDDGYIKVFYTLNGPANEKSLGSIDRVSTNLPNAIWRAQMVDRKLTLWRNGELMGVVPDTKAVTFKGPEYRGWGIGMVAGEGELVGQISPANVDWVRIEDATYYYSTNRWTLLSVAAVPVCRLRQSKKQKIIYSGSLVEWTEKIEDSFGFFNPGSSQTDIIVSEAGLYQVEASIQWDPKYVPDIASVVLLVNGQETTLRDQKFIRGNTFQPGFSQTMALAAKLRFSVNDVLQVKCKYSVGNSLLDLIHTFFDLDSKVNSRIDLHFLTP